MPDQGSWKITHSWGIKLDVSKCMVIFWGRIFLKHDIVPCFFLFGVGVMFVGPRLYRWDGPESPSTPRLVAASTDPHNAALCVAMDAHLAVVRSAFRRCELGCVQPDGGCEIEDQKPMPRYLKMEVKTSGSSVCIHMVYGIRYIYIYVYIIYNIHIYAVSKRSPPWPKNLRHACRRRQHLDPWFECCKGHRCFNRHTSPLFYHFQELWSVKFWQTLLSNTLWWKDRWRASPLPKM